MRRVAVSGLGVVSPMGLGLEAFFEALAAGRGGLRPISRFDPAGLEVRWAGEVPGLEALRGRLSAIHGPSAPPGAGDLPGILARDPKVAFALAAADEALEDAGSPRLGPGSLLHLGASLETYSLSQAGPVGGLGDLQTDRRLAEAPLRTPLDAAVALVEASHGRAGLALANCSACAAGLQAVGQAFRAVREGRFELALAGAFDSMINPLGLAGFQLLGAMAAGDPEPPWPPCRPFDAARRGLVMGEGAAAMVLEPLDKVLARGGRVHAEIVGYGASLDAHGLSAPDPEGSGAFRAMGAALSDAGLPPEAVGHLNSHGTGTLLNDPVEAMAVRRLFPNWRDMPVAAVKSMTGHAIAAAGALEAAACALTLARGLVPPNVGLGQVGRGCELDHVTGRARPLDAEYAMTNSFGFGGQNASLVMRRA